MALITAVIMADVLVYSMLIPLLPAYAAAYGLGQIELGLLLAAYAAGLLVATPVSGYLCDRHGRLGPLLTGLAGLVGASLLFAVSDSYPELVSARILQGAASGAAWTAGLALIADNYPAHERGIAMGTALSGNAGGMLLGPLFGGIAAQYLGLRLPFVAAAALAGAILASAWLLRGRMRRARPPRQRPQLKLLRDAGIRRLALGLLALTGIFTLIEPTLPLHFATRFQASGGTIGVLFAIVMLGHAVCTPVAGYCADRYGSTVTIRGGAIALAATLPLLALPAGLPLQSVLLLLFGMATAFALIPTLPLLAALVERRSPGAYAQAFALFNLVYAGGMMLGPALGSVGAQWLGLSATFSVAAALLLAALWRLPTADAADFRD